MREIKFRAWDKKNNKMYIAKKIHLVLKVVSVQFGTTASKSLYEPDYELMQFTGIKDKNGTEIYEGDIVGYSWLGDDLGYYATVPIEFADGGFKMFIERIDAVRKLNISGYYKEMVVIGNIYENPELLK